MSRFIDALLILLIIALLLVIGELTDPLRGFVAH